MTTLSSPLRKLALLAHVTASVGWVGAVLAFLPLAVIGVTSTDPAALRVAFVAMAWIVSYVIVPLALASLLTGLVSALGTTWGLFRHYWVVVKLVLTIVAVVVLLVQVAPIENLARVAGEPAASLIDLPEARRPLLHATGGLVVLVLIQVLGVFKPRGLTRYGWRMKERQA
jgi:hypothetical protein